MVRDVLLTRSQSRGHRAGRHGGGDALALGIAPEDAVAAGYAAAARGLDIYRDAFEDTVHFSTLYDQTLAILSAVAAAVGVGGLRADGAGCGLWRGGWAAWLACNSQWSSRGASVLDGTDSRLRGAGGKARAAVAAGTAKSQTRILQAGASGDVFSVGGCSTKCSGAAMDLRTR